MKKDKRKIVKIVVITMVILIIVLFILFLIFGEKFLKLEINQDSKTIETLVNNNEYEKPKITCKFFKEDISKSNLKLVRDVDINKIGTQTAVYECTKLFFTRRIEIKYNVVDKEAPTLELNGDTEISIYVGDEYKEDGAKATDNYDGDITDQIEISGDVITSKAGTYEIVYKVKDSSENESSVIRTIKVNEKPVQKVNNNSRSNVSSTNTSCGKPGTIYLTFDDGPNATYTPVILDVLKKYNVKATFFVTNSGPDELIKREFDEGHAVALHTATHVYSQVYASDEAYWNDIKSVSDRVERITGYKSTLIRFPGGGSNTVSRNYSVGIMSRLAEQMTEKGYSYFDWNISSGDAGGTTDPNVEYNNVIRYLSKSRGNVILMHDIKYHTSQAIDSIVKYGLDNGYNFDVLTSDVICHQQINN